MILSSLLVVALAAAVITTAKCQDPFLEGGDFGAIVHDLDEPATKLEDFSALEGVTPPHVVIDKIVSYPAMGQEDLIVLRNIGGQTADLGGWRISDEENVTLVTFGQPGCPKQKFLRPAMKLELRPSSDENPCGLASSVGFRDSVNVFDKDGNLVARVAWDASQRNTAFRRSVNGSYTVVTEDANILQTLDKMNTFEVILKALEAFGLDEKIISRSDPNYQGTEETYLNPKSNEPIIPLFPSHFGYKTDRSTMISQPVANSPPAPEEGVPKLGPFTVLAPTDLAFATFRSQVVGPGHPPLSVEKMLELPEMEHILLYHILPGLWTSEYLRNNTPIFTAKGVEVVPFADGAMGEGKIMLHDSCVDRPSPDPFSCEQQVDFGKCMDPFMTSPLAAEWQGGFCQRSCGRCTCDPRQGVVCAEIEEIDVMASNGVIHSINRLLFPPPSFHKTTAKSAGPLVIRVIPKEVESPPMTISHEDVKSKVQNRAKPQEAHAQNG